MASQIIICGHSHAVSLGVPLASEDSKTKLISLPHLSGRFFGYTGAWPRDEVYWKDLAKECVGRRVAIFWQGNFHHAYFLFAPGDLFDFVLSSDTRLPLSDAVIIPEEALRTRFLPTFEGLHKVIIYLKPYDCQIVLCGTPPPKGNEDRVRKMMIGEQHFKDVASHIGADLTTIRLAPLLVQYKLWKLTQSMLSDVAAAHNVDFFESPVETQTQDGFLKEEYYYDVTHANLTYGELCLNFLNDRF